MDTYFESSATFKLISLHLKELKETVMFLVKQLAELKGASSGTGRFKIAHNNNIVWEAW